MKTFLKEFWTSIVATVVLCIIVSAIYPVLIWGLGQLLFPTRRMEAWRRVMAKSSVPSCWLKDSVAPNTFILGLQPRESDTTRSILVVLTWDLPRRS